MLPLTTGDKASQAHYKVVSLPVKMSITPGLDNVCPTKVSQIGESSSDREAVTVSRWEFPDARFG